MLKICKVLELHQVSIHLWTDSSVALTWIKSHPSCWKDFVRTRVSFIQELSNSRWHYIAGKNNPADLASQGTWPHRLQLKKLWWTDPNCLLKNSVSWPLSTPTLQPIENLEERSPSCATANEKCNPDLWDLIEKYSLLSLLLRLSCACAQVFLPNR